MMDNDGFVVSEKYTKTHVFETAQELWKFLDYMDANDRKITHFSTSSEKLRLHVDVQLMRDGSEVHDIRIDGA